MNVAWRPNWCAEHLHAVIENHDDFDARAICGAYTRQNVPLPAQRRLSRGVSRCKRCEHLISMIEGEPKTALEWLARQNSPFAKPLIALVDESRVLAESDFGDRDLDLGNMRAALKRIET